MVKKLVLLRHGQSTFNKSHEFTGWTDVDVTDSGRAAAKGAGDLLRAHGFRFDEAHTSLLRRAIHTLWITLEEVDQMYLPVSRTWRLNERHYGALQELNKDELAKQLGEEQVKTWRRSFDVAPPALDEQDERHPKFDPRYAMLSPSELPATESLKDCIERVVPYWDASIAPSLRDGKTVLVVAHGNSLRALVKHIDGMSDEAIIDLNIPTATPLVYEFDDDLKPLKHYYLGNQEEINAAINAVASEGKGK